MEIAQRAIGAQYAELEGLIGPAVSSRYAPRCGTAGEDGEHRYDGFSVLTYREGTSELIEYVEISSEDPSVIADPRTDDDQEPVEILSVEVPAPETKSPASEADVPAEADDPAEAVAPMEAVGPSETYTASKKELPDVYSSGNPELDAAIAQIIGEYTDPSMSQEERLSALYDFMLLHCSYHQGNIYAVGETGWQVSEALSMVKNGFRGNCYGFAALFGELASAVGYPAEAFSGTIKGDSQEHDTTPHGWVEIEIDGKVCIFDPEMAYMQGLDLYMIPADGDRAERYEYNHDAISGSGAD